MIIIPEIINVSGIPFKFNSKTTLFIPPLSLYSLEHFQDRLFKFNGNIMEKDQIATLLDAATVALKRNYPEITREEVGELIDVANMGIVFECLMDISGVKRRSLKPGEILGN